jgi:hypothetical protein
VTEGVASAAVTFTLSMVQAVDTTVTYPMVNGTAVPRQRDKLWIGPVAGGRRFAFSKNILAERLKGGNKIASRLKGMCTSSGGNFN